MLPSRPRYRLVALLTALAMPLSGCAETGAPHGSESSPTSGRADGADQADVDCGVVLRWVSPPFENDTLRVNADSWLEWHVVFDVAEELMDAAAPGVLYRNRVYSADFEVASAIPISGAEWGYQRYRAAMALRTARRGDNLGPMEIEFVPFVKTASGTRRDYSRAMDYYSLNARNSWRTFNDSDICPAANPGWTIGNVGESNAVEQFASALDDRDRLHVAYTVHYRSEEREHRALEYLTEGGAPERIVVDGAQDHSLGIAVSTSGTVYVAYVAGTRISDSEVLEVGPDRKLWLKRRQPGGQWEDSIVAVGPAVGWNVHLAVTANDHVRLVYDHLDAGTVHYAHGAYGSLVDEEVATGAGAIDLAVRANGEPVVALQRWDGALPTRVDLIERTTDGWSRPVEVTSQGNGEGALALDHTGRAHLVLGVGQYSEFFVATSYGSFRKREHLLVAPPRAGGLRIIHGIPTVSVADGGRLAVGRVTSEREGFSLELVDTAGETGYRSQLLVQQDGRVVVVYRGRPGLWSLRQARQRQSFAP